MIYSPVTLWQSVGAGVGMGMDKGACGNGGVRVRECDDAQVKSNKSSVKENFLFSVYDIGG